MKACYKMNFKKVQKAKGKLDYTHMRWEIGITKLSIFSRLSQFLGVPGGFVLNLMHLISLNLTDLIVSLLHGTLTCKHPDNEASWDFVVFSNSEVWKVHGQLVTEATHYLPGSFDQPPRDLVKISSGSKAWEVLLYIYGLLPSLLCHLPPSLYYCHFCRLVFRCPHHSAI